MRRKEIDALALKKAKATLKEAESAPRPKKAKPVMASPVKWAEYRVMYESGQFKSMPAMYAHIAATEPEGTHPLIDSFKVRAAREKWNIGAHTTQIRETMANKFIRKAAEAGLNDELIVKTILNMIKDDNKGVNNLGLQRLYDITGMKAPIKTADTTIDGADVERTVIMLPKNTFESSND